MEQLKINLVKTYFMILGLFIELVELIKNNK